MPTLLAHMLTIDTTMVNFTSPAALRKLGSENAAGQSRELKIMAERMTLDASSVASAERLKTITIFGAKMKTGIATIVMAR